MSTHPASIKAGGVAQLSDVFQGDPPGEIHAGPGTHRPPGDDQAGGRQAAQDLPTFRLDLLAEETVIVNGNGCKGWLALSSLGPGPRGRTLQCLQWQGQR